MSDLNYSGGKTNEGSLSDLLARQMDSLNAGVDMTADLMEEYKDNPSAAGLMRLARDLHSTMVPVRPSPEFVNKLRHQLEHTHSRRTHFALRWTRRQRNWAVRASRVFGTAVSLLAVFGLAFRVLVSFVMLVMLLVRQKQRTTAAA